MSEALIIAVLIQAKDMASMVLARLGIQAKSTFGTMQMAAAGVAGGLIAIGAAANHYASDFQTQFAKISGLTGSSAEMINYYKQQILQLSPTFDMTATDAAKALYFIISAGFSGAKAMDILRYSSMSANASLADQATVADALTSMLNAYKDANISVAEATNDLTKIEVYGKAQLQSFASSLGFTMVTAHASGISIGEASAAISALSQVSGNHGIRRISMEFDNLARSLLDINAIAKRAKAQGLNFDAASFSTMTFIQKLQYLQSITGALSSNINDETFSMMKNADASKLTLAQIAALDLHLDKANSAFMKLTGGAAAFIPAAILLSGKAQQYSDDLAHMHNKQDMVTDAFINMRNTANQQWKMMEIGVQNVLIVLGLQLLPILQNVYHAVYLVANAFLTWVENTGNMEAFKYALLGIAIVVSTILLPAMIKLTLAFVTNPVAVTIMAIVAAGILLGNVLRAHPEIIRRVQQALAVLGTVLGHVKDGAVAVVGKFVQFAQWVRSNETAFTAFKAVLAAIAILLLNVAVNAAAAFIAGLIEMIPYILLSTAMLWGMAAAVIAATWPFIVAGLAIAALVFAIMELVQHGTQVKKFFGDVFSKLGTIVHDSLSSVGKSVGDLFSDLGTTVHNGLSSLGRTIGGIFSSLGTLVHNGLMKIGAAIDWFVHQTPQKIAYMVGYAIGYLIALPIRGLELILGFVVGAAQWLDHLRTEAAERLAKFVEDAVTFLEHLRVQAQAKIIAFVVGAASSIARFAQAAPGIILKMGIQIVLWLLHMKDEAIKHIIAFTVAAVAELTKLWHEAPGFILKLVLQVVTYFTNLRTQAGQKVQDTRTAIGKELQKLPGQALQAAKDFVMGLVHGIEGGAKWVWDAITHLASGMIDGFKKALGIHSPSTVMFAHGVSLVQGLILGFRSIDVGAEWTRHVGTLRPPTLAPVGEGGYLPRMGQAGGGYGRLRMPQAAGNVTHNWTLNFPNAVHKHEIKAAVLELQQETYRRVRRPGGYAGFGSDYTSDS